MKQQPKDCLYYDALVCYRWKALIRSEEYKEFYESADIESLIEEKGNIEYEISGTESDLIREEADGELNTPSLDEFLKSVDGSYTQSEMSEYFIGKCRDLAEQRSMIEDMENKIRSEVKRRFGLIATDMNELKPIDRTIDTLAVTFKEYLPQVWRTSPTRLLESNVVTDVINTVFDKNLPSAPRNQEVTQSHNLHSYSGPYHMFLSAVLLR